MKPETETYVSYVAQASIANGVEWGPWQDMAGPGVESLDIYSAIGKMDMYHHFMLHGTYPEPYGSAPEIVAQIPALRKLRNVAIDMRKNDGYKIRTRIVKRTVTVTLVDEETDKPTIVVHGEKT